jgi:hypothetical protein
MKKAFRVLGIGLLMTALLAPTAAVAKDGVVIKTGACSEASTWKLKLTDEDLGKEIKIEVDQNVVGDRWRVRMLVNGELVVKGTRVTKAPSGSFTVRRIVVDSPERDRVKVRARNLTTGELCVARAGF